VLDVGTRERSSEREREAILGSVVEIAAEHGYAKTTIGMIVEHAGLDRAAFDRHFHSKHECFLVAWQEMNESCMREMLEAYNGEEDWRDRLRAVVCVVVDSLRREPCRAAFAIEVLAVGDAARARRDMTMRVVASLIDAGRGEMADPESVPHTTAEALAGAAYGQIYSRIVRRRADELQKLVPRLMAAAVMPYLGIDAGLAELTRGFPAPERYRRDVAKRSTSNRGNGNEGAEGYPPELARLPPGRHGLPREFVAHNQRERLIAGLAEAVAEHGYSGTTIAHITSHAAVSRRTFYEHFSSKDECFVAAYDTVMNELRGRVEAGFEGAADWPHAVRSGIAAMLAFLAAEPHLARLCMVEALVAGPVVVERYDAAIQSFVPYFQSGREGRSPEVLARLSPTTEEALVGGMVSLISRRIIAGKAEQLEKLLPDLVEFTLTPYLGSEEAAKIAREKD
jgi:AcrR family transcriptional regulator